jgi:hypothetical protein
MDDVTLHPPELPADLNDLSALTDRQIRLFLNGDSDGRELLRGLYGDAVDEPIPARLRGVLRH